MIEVATRIASHTDVEELLPLLRSRITKLERALANHPIDKVITAYANRLTLLNLRKLYLSVYCSSLLHQSTYISPESLQRLYKRMMVLRNII